MIMPSENLHYRLGYYEGYHAGLADGLAGEDPEAIFKDIYALPLRYLELSTRVYNCLRNWYCQTIGDVAQMPLAVIEKTPHLGDVGINEVIRALHSYNIRHTAWDVLQSVK